MTDAATDKPCLVITNADDFGLSERENAAILAGFAEGVISSATLMANMPAFEQACQAARQRGLADRLGLHFNLSYGEPLSWSVRGVSALCNVRGQFDFSLPRYSLYLSGQISQAIRTELEAQWQACVEQGLRPTHIDSHQHVHNVLPIAAIVASFAAGHGVPVRLARNVGYNIHPGKAVFKYLLNRLIRRRSRTAIRYVCTPKDLLDGLRPQGVVEIICHPELCADGQVGDAYLPAGKTLHQVLDVAYPYRQLVSYGSWIYNPNATGGVERK